MTSGRPDVLIVEDDIAVAKVLGALLSQDGMGFAHAATGAQALKILEDRPFEAIVTDLRMPGMDGLTLLKEVKRRWPGQPVVMLTAHGSVPIAVDAMKAGAAEFVMKPFDHQEILYVVRKAIATCRNDSPDALPLPEGATRLIGVSAAMAEVEALIGKAAPSRATVLIRGESGTGKELVARALHERSPRRDKPLVALHCAALPEGLLESELFGYEKGAFTGATRQKPGRIELAQGGTLFLDEIGDVPPSVQVKLLRVLQERELVRVGGTRTVPVDVRVVAATHCDLEAMLPTGKFREDLFYRLNVVPIYLRPLRDRPDDIAPLVRHFWGRLAEANDKPELQLDAACHPILTAQSWPGNIRQLQNFIERLIVLSDGSVVGPGDVERELGRGSGLLSVAAPSAAAIKPGTPIAGSGAETLDETRRHAERDALVAALTSSRNNRSQAARLLGVSRRTLYNKLQEHALA